MEYTVPLALQDYMTVIFSAIGLTLLTRMVAQIDRELGRMALIGTVLTVTGGALKASGKLVLALGGPDIAALNLGLFPLVAPGFTLVAWALYQVRRFFRDQTPLRRPWLAPLGAIALFAAGSAALFAAGGPWRVPLILQATIFNTFLLVMLAVAAWRRQMRGTAVLFIVTLAVVLVMAQLAGKPFGMAMVWFEQVTQTVAQALFAVAAGAYGREMTTSYRRAAALQPA